jgi:hypothetical protein
MKHKVLVFALAAVTLLSLAGAQQNPPKPNPTAGAPQPAYQQLADELARRLASELSVKTVVGEPIKAGSVTLVPIMMLDVSFGGGGGSAPQMPAMGGSGFFMKGEARPLGFVAVGKKGTRFISVGRPLPPPAGPPGLPAPPVKGPGKPAGAPQSDRSSGALSD